MDEERGLRSAGWRVAAVRGSGGGPGEAAGEHAGPRTSTPGLRPSHRNGPAHRTKGGKIRAKKKKSTRAARFYFSFSLFFLNRREK